MTCLADSEHLGCTSCPLHLHRNVVVPGHGNVLARIMLVGEAPGQDEDAIGEPFVGRAGKELNFLLGEVGLKREDLFLSNIIHCRPPGNDLRPFVSSTIICPQAWLEFEMCAIRPRVVVALGVTAGLYFFPGLTSAHEMAKTMRPVTRPYWAFTAIGSYHPSYVLKSRLPWVRDSIKASLRMAKEAASQ